MCHLICFCCHLQVPNQRDIVGILNEVVDCKGATSNLQYRFVSAAMCWLDRHGLGHIEAMKVHIAQYMSCWVDCMVEAWRLTKAKTRQARLLTYFALHKAKL